MIHKNASFLLSFLFFSLLTLPLFHFTTLSLYSEGLKVYYLNVGQGDSTYITFPDGKNMLIDGGPSSDESIYNPVIGFLKTKKVSKINYMLLSHPHSDHVNGLYAVLKMCDVEKVYDTGVDNSSSTIDDSFRSIAGGVSGRYNIVASTGFLAGFSVSSITVTVLHTNTVAQKDLNDNSIVIRIQFSSSTFIFGGDATGSTVESKLVSWHGTGIQADCYKVHHHGSKYSSYDALKGVAFLNNLQPKYAFIQVGKNNYGQPSTEAINRISNFTGSANIYRTDYNGTIFVYTTGDGKYSIQTNYIPVPDEEEKPPTDGGVAPRISAPSIKSEFIILEARNNIFNPKKEEKVYLAYSMESPGKIYINIYTLFGELIRSDEYYEERTGLTVESKWSWDGKNEKGELVAPGVYLFHIQTPLKTAIKKVVVIR